MADRADAEVTTNRLASVLGKPLATREDLFPEKPVSSQSPDRRPTSQELSELSPQTFCTFPCEFSSDSAATSWNARRLFPKTLKLNALRKSRCLNPMEVFGIGDKALVAVPGG